MLIFAEKNKELRERFAKEFLNIPVVEDAFSVPYDRIVSCSNPWLGMEGGLDALILDKHFEECKAMQRMALNLEPGTVLESDHVVFAVTVDAERRADETVIRRILFILKEWYSSTSQTTVFTGLGCGIGGLSHDTFIGLCKEVFGHS